MFTVQPAPPLRKYIECYYGEETIIREYKTPQVPHHLILLPLACVEMHFCYYDTSLFISGKRNGSQFRSLIVGGHDIHTHHIVNNFREVAKQIHVKFKPGGFCELLGIPEIEIRDSFMTTDMVLGNDAGLLEDNLNNACSTQERVDILDRFLTGRLSNARKEKRADQNDSAVKWIIESRGTLKVATLLDHMSVSKRTLERHFTSRFGLTPKEFARVVRFKVVLNTILSTSSVDWQELVDAYGYYDQSHLINEFRRATTFPPELFLRQKGNTVIKYKTGIFLTRPLDTQPTAYREIMKETFENEIRNGTGRMSKSPDYRRNK